MDLEVPGGINPSQYQVPAVLPRVCFRAYDIRGPVDADHLTPNLAYAIGLAVGSILIGRNKTDIIIARDGRLSGPEFADALCAGLLATGMNVIFIGVVPTPVLYFATNQLETNCGIMVTASHNPGHHNGFKIVLEGKTLTQDGIAELYQRIQAGDFVTGSGQLTTREITADYIDYITSHVILERPMKVVLDCGNGVGGELGPKLFKALGCEVVELHCEIDGRFPNHHPDPTIPENLADLIEVVKREKADVGFALDGDADRLGMVTDQGEIIWPDRQMMLFSSDILSRNPGAKIIFDVKCSTNLREVIKSHGGEPIMWRTGHSVIKAKLFEEEAPFAGELSGHLFFKEGWFGFDDGMYVGARMLEILTRLNKSASQAFAELPNSVNTPELKLPMPESKKYDFIQRLVDQGEFPGANKITIDGVRLEFDDGWALARASNTSPYITLRFEAETDQALERIKKLMSEQLLKIESDLELPY